MQGSTGSAGGKNASSSTTTPRVRAKIACTSCRESKLKCENKIESGRPSLTAEDSCTRCSQIGGQCVYEVSKRRQANLREVCVTLRYPTNGDDLTLAVHLRVPLITSLSRRGSRTRTQRTILICALTSARLRILSWTTRILPGKPSILI